MNEELLSQARDCLTLQTIYLRESRLTMSPEFNPAGSEQFEVQLKIGLESVSVSPIEPHGAATDSGKLIRGEIAAGVRLVAASVGAAENTNPRQVMAELSASFRCEYECAGRHQLSEAAINEFLTHNAKMNVWPYWREFVQTTFSRAHLPPITLPLMVIKPAAKKETPVPLDAPDTVSAIGNNDLGAHH